ncbi:hypothetical protein [Streptomyces asiaticus]
MWPGRYWLNPSAIARKVRSTFPFAGPFAGGTGCTDTPRLSHAETNDADTYTRPWSTTTVSGMITGRAAACSSRASNAISRS